MKNHRYAIITPVRDEAKHIQFTLESVVSQSITPMKWIIVDDGSVDGTGEILDAFAATHEWMEVLHRKNRGFRASGGGVMEAFYDGYALLEGDSWDFLVKLDGDLSFDSLYFERCLDHFDAQEKLGIGGGTVCVNENGRPVVDSIGDPPFHVRGATKIYRRACWEQIDPLPKVPGWDTIDEVKANFHGWHTKTFKELHLMQHKPTGSSDGRWRNWYKNGVANYMTGYHPVFMLAKCLKRAAKKPLLIGSTALLAGYCKGYFKRTPMAIEMEVIRYLRRQQMRRLMMKNSIYGS